MRESSKRIISLFFAAILFVAAIMLYANLIVPTYAEINKLRAEANAKEEALASQDAIVKKVETLLKTYRSIPDLRALVSLAVPNSEDTSSAFGQIYAIAKDTGMGIQQFSVNTAAPIKSTSKKTTSVLKNVGTVEMQVALIGEYANLKRFIDAVERNFRIMDVENLKVQPVVRGSNIYLFNLTLNAYYQSM